MTSFDVQGVSAIVTGGASGLGNETARRLVAGGAHVVVVDLPDREGETTRADAVAALGDAAEFCPGDVSQADSAIEAVERAQAVAPLRVLVNCAGVATPGKLVGRKGPLELNTLMTVLNINIGGTVNFMGQAAAAMQQNDLWGEDRGVIINTASVAAFEGQIGQIAYSASKGGVAAITLPAARELAEHQIRVMTIAPGIFETPMMAGLPEKARKSLAENTPHPARLGLPSDYALTVEQIVSNSMLNGSVIRLDGAVRMEPK